MLDPSRYALDAATVGFRKRMGLEVNWDSFHNAVQNQTDAIKVRRELEETAISELHVMGGQRFGVGGNEKTNTDARQMRQMNGYPLRSFLATGGAIVVPPKHSEGLLATPMNMGLTQYTQYNGVVGNYVSSFTEPLNAPLENQSILLARAGIAARSESASNPFKTLQFMLNMHESQQSIADNERGHQNLRGYNQQGVMQDAVNAMEAPMKESAKKRRAEESDSARPDSAKLAHQKKEKAGAEPSGSSKLAKEKADNWQKKYHERINAANPIERNEDGTVATIQHQQVQHDQEALLEMRLMDAAEEEAVEKEIDALGVDDRMAYDDLRPDFTHEEALQKIQSKRFSVLAARESLQRDQQTYHIASNASTPSSDANKSIISEMTNSPSGGQMNSLYEALLVSRTLLTEESGTPNFTPAEQALSFTPIKPTRPNSASPYVSQAYIAYKSQQDTAYDFAPSPGQPRKGRLTMGGGEQTSFGGDITKFGSPASAAESETFFNRARQIFSSSKKSTKVTPVQTPVPINPSTHYSDLGVITPRGNIVHQTAIL